MADSDFVKVADVGELSPGDMKVVEVGDDQVLVVNCRRHNSGRATISAPTPTPRCPRGT